MSAVVPPEWDREKIARELDRLRWEISKALGRYRQATEGMQGHPLIRAADQQTDGLISQVADYAQLTRQGVAPQPSVAPGGRP